MGRDKASLSFQGSTLLERMRSKAAQVSEDVRIVGPQSRFGADAVEDRFRDAGPLAGIHAALRSSRQDMSLVLAVDLPFLVVPFLEYLVRQAKTANATVTVPKLASGWQPLCAVYHKTFADIAELALRARRYKIDALFSGIPLRIIEGTEVEKAGFEPSMFDNLNTPEDLARAGQRP